VALARALDIAPTWLVPPGLHAIDRDAPDDHHGELADVGSTTAYTVPALAQRLGATRLVCGLTQDQLANQSRVPLAALAAMEGGLHCPPYFTDAALVVAVRGVDADWLYDGEHALQDAETTP
jgi:hypothetical protein